MAKTRGLPETKKMRHDAHFVDRLTARPTDAVGRQIPVSQIDPNPNQPRKSFSGLKDLVASIQEKGVLEPLLVRKIDERFEIIAGERRFRAAQEAGLRQVPCIEIDVDDRGCLEISLVENLQRRDLNPFEEADALAQLRERFDFTHEEIARKLSRSRTSVTESLSLATLPKRIRKRCEKAGIMTRSTLLQLARLPEEQDMETLLDSITRQNLSRDDVRRMVRPAEEDPRPRRGEGSGPAYVYRYRPPERPYSFSLKVADREDLSRGELIDVLEEILEDLRQN